MKLIEHIELDHSGSLTIFASTVGVSYQQVQRWIKLDCIWHEGRVYAPKTPEGAPLFMTGNVFVEKKATANSISCRKLVCGVGINDAEYSVNHVSGGRRSQCPFYERWASMLNRCYGKSYQTKYPTYIGCSVCDEWLVFSVFKLWMVSQDWKGMHLDKDVAIPGNKIYSPECCRFITPALNSLLNDSKSTRGDYSIGVYFRKDTGKYKAQISDLGDYKFLGYHDTESLASSAYAKAKRDIILRFALEQGDEAISRGLRLHADIIGNHLSDVN